MNASQTSKRFKINALKGKIATQKKFLANEDYKIIKCMEYKLLHPEAPLSEYPYEVEALISHRDAVRGGINRNEAEIAELEKELGIDEKTPENIEGV